LHAVSHILKTWSLDVKKNIRQRPFEKRMLREIFGPKKYKVMGGWVKLHNGELRNF
jgi:hypothetical protein